MFKLGTCGQSRWHIKWTITEGEGASFFISSSYLLPRIWIDGWSSSSHLGPWVDLEKRSHAQQSNIKGKVQHHSSSHCLPSTSVIMSDKQISMRFKLQFFVFLFFFCSVTCSQTSSKLIKCQYITSNERWWVLWGLFCHSYLPLLV